MKRLFVVGDVHGCREELVKLLAITDHAITDEDEYVFLGDFIDRGPDSKGVIDILIERAKNHKIKHTFLAGNHEDMMMEGADYWALNGGIETLKSYGLDIKDYNAYMSKIPDEHVQFLNSLKLKYQVGRTVCVHASLDPFFAVDSQSRQELLWGRRYTKYEGDYVGDVKVIRGHTPSYELVECRNQLGIDTACVFGNKLTCAVIEPEAGDMTSLFQVKSGFTYE